MICCYPQSIYIEGVWWKTQDVTYATNQAPCNMPSCQTALAQGRYRWPTTSVLDESDCSEMKVDLGIQLVFFPNISHTIQRPNIGIWSPNDRKLVMVELTVPWETICEEAYERKMVKYADLKEQCRRRG